MLTLFAVEYAFDERHGNCRTSRKAALHLGMGGRAAGSLLLRPHRDRERSLRASARLERYGIVDREDTAA